MKPSILIVDDEKDTRELMARALGTDYRVTTAADAELAIKALEADPSIALMLSDVRMPGADGLQLLKAAKKMRPNLACILLTAFGTVDQAVAAIKKRKEQERRGATAGQCRRTAQGGFTPTEDINEEGPTRGLPSGEGN